MPASSAGAICDGWAYPLLEGGFPFWGWAKIFATFFFWRNLLLLVKFGVPQDAKLFALAVYEIEPVDLCS